MGISVTASVSGSILQRAPYRGVTAQTAPAPASTCQTALLRGLWRIWVGRVTCRGLDEPTAGMRTTCRTDQSPIHTVSRLTTVLPGFIATPSTVVISPVAAWSRERLP